MQNTALAFRSFPLHRQLIFGGVLFAALAMLVVELALLAPRVLESWRPYDYGLYLEMGRAVREGVNPVGARHYYPLPTVLWLFAPLSLLPDWFRLVWVIAPFASILTVFRARGILLALFTPLWFNISDAMLDAWLLIPMLWLLENRPVLAGLGAVALLLKPQLALLTIAYRLVQWTLNRDGPNLATFVGALTVFCLPAFIFDAAWIEKLLAALPQRAHESIAVMPLLTSSVWAWWYLDESARFAFAAIVLASAAFVWRAWSSPHRRAALVQQLNQLFVPVLFAANLVTILPTLRGHKQLLTVVAISLAALALDFALKGFGGGYALIPLAALYFQTTNGEQPVTDDGRRMTNAG